MFFKGYDNLPTSIGVFALDDVILLPHMHLTLNVFEPRYLNLIEDAFQNERMIAITQPKNEEPRNDKKPNLFEVGSIGRIVAFQEEDMRLLISLEGMIRVRLGEESHSDRGYRVFATDYNQFECDKKQAPKDFLDRKNIMPLLESYFKHLDVDLSADKLSHISDERLIYSVAMLGNFDSLEKQALLECVDILKQTEMLQTLIRMALQQGSGNNHDIV